jgi:hypothetical protein
MGSSSALSKVLPETGLFPLIGLPHRNDVPSFTARRPDHDDHPASQVPDSDEPRLAVVLSVVDPVERHALEYFGGVGKVEAALFQSEGALAWIKR